MRNETEFWHDVAKPINPGWTVRVDPMAAGPTVGLGRNDVIIYVVDVASDWFGAVATSTSDAAKMLMSCRALL